MNLMSVVIATYTRETWLKELISALQNQIVPVDIIICDDGSSPFSLKEYSRGLTRYVWAKRTGYHRVARFNEGVSLATTPNVVLLDDDCLPQSDHWSEAHLEGLGYTNHYNESAYQGRILRGLFKDGDEYKLTPWFSSNNVSIPTLIAKNMGPFDPNYDGNYGFEDNDLGLEFKRRGYFVATGNQETAILHRGDQRHEYHTGVEINRAYYKKKWGIE